MKPLTVDILVKCGADRTAAARYVDTLNELLPYYFINNHARLSYFLGQLMHESIQLTHVEEIASGAAYEGRKTLGNIYPGDGIRFKGRGLIQITGRSNYASMSRKFGIDFLNNPEKLTETRWAVASALWYWGTRSLNNWADRGDFLKITKLINGGTNGLKDREKYTKLCKIALAPLFR